MTKENTQFVVIVGTYEEFVLGYEFSFSSKEGKEGDLDHIFAVHSHCASVRCVASGGKLVVSGGSDETINIYNMFTRKECGMLMEHDGTITSLSFTPDCSHLISTSDDGSIKIFRQGSWQMEKVWPKAHKGTAVTCLSVHPSGKMALSVGKDHTLRTWNLVKGRPAYTTNLYSRCRQLEYVVWSPGGGLFAIPMDLKLEITSTEKAGVLHTLQFQSKVTVCIFLTDNVVCVGEASGVVTGHCTQTAQQLWSVPGEHRVRGVAYMHSYLVTGTSSGTISVYSAANPKKQPQLVTSTDTGCRITCLTLCDPKSDLKIKTEPVDVKKEEGEKYNSCSTLDDKIHNAVPTEITEFNNSKKQESMKRSADKEFSTKSTNKSKRKHNTFATEDGLSPETHNHSKKQPINHKGLEAKRGANIDSRGKRKFNIFKSEKIDIDNPKRKMNVKNCISRSSDILCSPGNHKWLVESSNGKR